MSLGGCSADIYSQKSPVTVHVCPWKNILKIIYVWVALFLVTFCLTKILLWALDVWSPKYILWHLMSGVPSVSKTKAMKDSKLAFKVTMSCMVVNVQDIFSLGSLYSIYTRYTNTSEYTSRNIRRRYSHISIPHKPLTSITYTSRTPQRSMWMVCPLEDKAQQSQITTHHIHTQKTHVPSNPY